MMSGISTRFGPKLTVISITGVSSVCTELAAGVCDMMTPSAYSEEYSSVGTKR